MRADELPEAGLNELLADYLSALADLRDVAGEWGDAAIVEVARRRAQEAEDAYLRAREVPSDAERRRPLTCGPPGEG